MHLIVCSHGLYGSPENLETILEQLKNMSENVFILNIDAYPKSETWDGIDVCGDKAVAKILENLDGMETISFIGYSMGGLILRYAIGKLYNMQIFNKIKPMHYISIACPQLGTRKPLRGGVFARLFNAIQSSFVARVGKQFAVCDDYINNRPLLVVMSDPNYSFYKGLKLFKLTLFANIQCDRLVRYTTSSISSTNPYNRFSAQVINEEYPSLVRPKHGVPLEPVKRTWPEFFKTSVFVLFLPVLFPLWLGLVGTFLTVQHVKANQRIKQGVKSDNEWVYSEFDTIDPVSGIVVEEHVREIIVDIHDVNRKFMLKNLDLLPWTRIDVSIKALNSHAAIVQRGSYKGFATDVTDYLVNQVLKDLQ